MTIIGTASDEESVDRVTKSGAHFVIDHRLPLSQEVARIGHSGVRYVLSLTATSAHWDEIVALLGPQGEICLIDDPGPLDMSKLKIKAGTLHCEFMFARSKFQTDDMIAQHELLTQVAALVDAGLVRTTMTGRFGAITAADLRRAHAAVERGRTTGKVVLEAA